MHSPYQLHMLHLYSYSGDACACLPTFDFVFGGKKAIITVCNCCWDFYLTTNRAVRAQYQMHTHTHSDDLSVSESSSSSTPSVWFGIVLSFFYLPSLFPPPLPALVFVLPYLLTLSCPNARPPARGYRRLPKSRKRRCVIN